MNKKILSILITMFAFSLILTPLAVARPGVEKTNEKFEFFELVCSGAGSGVFDREWWTTMVNLEDANKTYHTRGGGWVTGETVELTVGSDTYTMTTSPISVGWTTTTFLEAIWNNDGTLKRYNIRLTDVVTVYNTTVEIGTLVLELKSTIVPGRDPLYSGVLVGYGTDAFKGVRISGIDVGLIGPGLFMRNGTITGWPI